MAKTKVLICPYCGETQPAGDVCKTCGGLFEPLSRQATHNAMGPWFIRDPGRPHQPGCSYETLTKLIQRGAISKLTIVRGPTTKQFWTVAKRVGGVSHLLGYCHLCDSDVKPTDHGCAVCGATFGAFLDRNYLGLPELRPLPWEESITDYSGSPAGPVRVNGPSGISAFQTAGPGRISSFATNEEIVDAGIGQAAQGVAGPMRPVDENPPVPAQQPAGTDTTATGASVEQTAATPVPTAASSATAMMDESALRLARRRAMQYQKTTHRLWIALAISVVVIMALTTMLVKKESAAGAGAAQSSATNSITDHGGTNAPAAPNGAGEKSIESADRPAPEEVADDAAKNDIKSTGDEGGAKEPDVRSPGDPETQKYEAILAEIDEATRSAKDEALPLADRIAHYERVIELLNDVRINAPASVRPADVAERIEQASREVERLRLREFFP